MFFFTFQSVHKNSSEDEEKIRLINMSMNVKILRNFMRFSTPTSEKNFSCSCDQEFFLTQRKKGRNSLENIFVGRNDAIVNTTKGSIHLKFKNKHRK